MKSYTNIEQSKKLAKILSLESADSHYVRNTYDFMGNPVDGKWSHPKYGNPNSRYANYIVQNFSSYEIIPCWSLVALLIVLPQGTRLIKSATDEMYHCDCPKGNIDKWFDNPIDACYDMIIKLHEDKLL